MATLVPITAQQGDTLDLLLWRERGLGPADISAILDSNPGLAALGSVLPMGTIVLVPAVTTPAQTSLPLIQLWD